MSKRFQKKTFLSLKKQEEAILDRDLENFEGSSIELFFIKLSRKIARNRLAFFGSILFVFFVLGSILGYFEFIHYKEVKSSEKLESIRESWLNLPSPSLEKKIEQLERFRKEDAYGSVKTWSAKILADLYVELKNYEKAASLLEEVAPSIQPYLEARAYYYFLAGNYRELSGNFSIALKNFERSNELLEKSNEVPFFKGWSYYHTARLNYEQGNLEKAKINLEKIFLLEPSELNQDLTDLKKQATYLLLKISGKQE